MADTGPAGMTGTRAGRRVWLAAPWIVAVLVAAAALLGRSSSRSPDATGTPTSSTELTTPGPELTTPDLEHDPNGDDR